MVLLFATTMLFSGLQGNIVLSEIMYDPDRQTLGIDDEMEWIELFNPTAEDVNLAGMMLADRGNQLFLEDFILPSGSYAVVCASESAFRSAYGDGIALVPWSGQWTKLSNSGDEITLYANDGRVLEYLSYSDTWGADDSGSSRADGDGASLERIDLLGPNDESNWQPSEDYANPTPKENGDAVCWGTPGAVNSIAD